MKIGFRPQTHDDWLLLMRFAKLIRLSSREALEALVDYGEAQRKPPQTLQVVPGGPH